MTCPTRQPEQSHDEHQREVAKWLGCTVEDMNADHDPLHTKLCAWLQIRSHSLACARGEPYDREAAEIEEAAVMHVQRFACRYGMRL